MNNLLSSEEVKRFLEVEEPDLEGLMELGKLHAYKIGGTYLRFRKEEVLNLKQELFSGVKKSPISLFSRAHNFWRFNNFYIISLTLIAVLLYVMVRS